MGFINQLITGGHHPVQILRTRILQFTDMHGAYRLADVPGFIDDSHLALLPDRDSGSTYCLYGGFLKWWYPNSRMVYNGKSYWNGWIGVLYPISGNLYICLSYKEKHPTWTENNTMRNSWNKADWCLSHHMFQVTRYVWQNNSSIICLTGA